MFDKQIRRLKMTAALVVFGTVAVGVTAYLAYEVLLDKQAKQDLKNTFGAVSDSGRQLANLVNDHIGTIMDDEVVAQNRQQVKEAWAALGY